MAKQPGFFDFDDRMRRLSDLGDRLEAFAEAVDFEMFRSELEAALSYSDGAKGGRLHRHIRADCLQHARRRTQAAQQRGRDGGHQARQAGGRDLVRQAGQGPPEGRAAKRHRSERGREPRAGRSSSAKPDCARMARRFPTAQSRRSAPRRRPASTGVTV